MRFVFASILLLVITVFSAALPAAGQSTSISFPTPLYDNEVSGTIRARDIGDSRLTSYFYTFQGNQGDVFVNVLTKNFNGDIDVFLAEGLKPLTKVPIYADNGETETGRVIYLRKPEKLILRIEGRTPNDDPATFQIKFAGSFEASKETTPEGADLPKVENVAEGNVRVNSVGTIVAVIPKAKPTPKPAETVAEKAREQEPEAQPSTAQVNTDVKSEPAADANEKKTEVVITENVTPAEPVSKRTAPSRTRGRRTTPPRKTVVPPESTEAAVSDNETSMTATSTASRASGGRRPKSPPKSNEPDPLASIFLVIEFKDGRRVERPMSEVLRFSVDRGILTVVSKDGTIGRYPILDVVRTTIQ